MENKLDFRPAFFPQSCVQIRTAEYGLKFLDRFVCAKGIDK